MNGKTLKEHELEHDILGVTEEIGKAKFLGGGGGAGSNASETDPIVGAVNGIVKADGAGNISVASDGTDYLSPITGLKLDQTTPQNVTGGQPDFNAGLRAGSTDQLSIDASGNLTTTGTGSFNSVVIPTVFTAMTEPSGFVDRTATLSFVDATRVFTITGNHDIYINGVKTTKGTASITINDATGMNWIYYNASGVLSQATSIPSFSLPLIATLYYNTVTDKGLLGEERHGIKMDGDTHHLMHNTVGVRYESGLAGTFADTTFSIALGKIDDEDLEHTITPAQTTCNVLYKDGAADFKWLAGQTVYYYTSGGNLYYNNGNTLTALGANKYMAVWIFATNDTTTPIVSLIGQRTDDNIADARANNKYESLTLGTLPFQEMKLLYRVILRNDATPYEEAQDLRNISNLPAGTYVATDHGVLTGLGDDDHAQYWADTTIGTRTTNYATTGSLSAGAITGTSFILGVNTMDADVFTLSLPANTTISTFGASLIDDAAAANVIATLGLDADIATLSLPASTTITAAAATILDDTTVGAIATTLGLGTTDNPTFGHLHLNDDTNQIVLNADGGVAALTLTGASVTSAKTITFPNFTGTVYVSSGTDVAVADGGTNLSTIADGSVLATNAVDVLSAITWHSAGTKVLTNTSGTISWETASAGGLADGDYGDITVGGTGTTMTIDVEAVTYAKMQHISATDKLLGRVSALAGDVEEVTCTDFAQSILDDAAAVNVIATLGLDADIATLSLPASTTITAAAATILDDVSVAAIATTLGLGTADSPQFATIELGAATDTTIARVSAGVVSIEGKNIYLAGGADVVVADGGTNKSSWTQYAIPYASTTTVLSEIAIGAAGKVLAVAAGATGYEWASMLTNPMTAVGDIIYGGASGVPTRLADVAVGSVLVSGGVTTAPAWSSSPTIGGNLTVSGELLGARESFVLSNATGGSGAIIYFKAGEITMTATKGLLMPRAGSIVGISLQYDITADNVAAMALEVYKDGVSVWSNTLSHTVAADKEAYFTQARNTDTFTAGQVLTVGVTQGGGAKSSWDDGICVLEVVFDS